jgi:hypothetical protein
MTTTPRPGLLVKLTVSIWTGTAQLEAPDLGLSDADISADYALGRKRLVPKDALDPIHTAARRAKYALDTLSLAMPDGGRFVLRETVPEVLAELDRQRTAFQAAVDAFLAEYPRLREQMRPQWIAAAEQAWATQHARHPHADHDAWVQAFLARVDRAYPDLERLRRKFDFFWYTYQLALSELEEVDATAVAREEEARRARDAAYQAEVRARLDDALSRGIAALHDSVAQAFQRIIEHITSGRPLSDAALRRVRDTISRFRKLNVWGDSALDRALADFERDGLAAIDAAAVNRSTDLRTLFQQGLQRVVDAATAPEGDLSPLTGRLRRRFAVDPAASSAAAAP